MKKLSPDECKEELIIILMRSLTSLKNDSFEIRQEMQSKIQVIGPVMIPNTRVWSIFLYWKEVEKKILEIKDCLRFINKEQGSKKTSELAKKYYFLSFLKRDIYIFNKDISHAEYQIRNDPSKEEELRPKINQSKSDLFKVIQLRRFFLQNY